MTRMKLLFAAAAVLAVSIAAVPAANAQVVHYIGAGSSAMFQGFEVAAVNDLPPLASACSGGVANAQGRARQAPEGAGPNGGDGR